MARAGCTYKFIPVLMDRNLAPSGTLVRVVPASGLGVSGRLPSRFAYIEYADGTMIGMCCAASLQPRRPKSAYAQAAEACGLTRVVVTAKHSTSSPQGRGQIMYVSWRRQETITQSKQIERVAARVAREIMFYRSGMSASVPTWARAIANDLSISQTEMRATLANKLAHDRGQF